jgi:hypothetical protein
MSLRCTGFCVLISILVALGCAPLYFEKVPSPQGRPVKFALEDWPYGEYWTGVVFNGKKIGFTHLSLDPSPDGRYFTISSEASFQMRLLAISKEITLISQERVTEELELVDFSYDFHMDQSLLQQEGRIEGDTLIVRIKSADKEEVKRFPIREKIYPSGAITMLPVLWGLEVGRRYEYMVYSPESRSVERVTQEVLSYERSKLFEGRAFKVRTLMLDQEVDTWLDERGLPLLEMSLGGVLISYLEDEITARRYLLKAALNKEETLLNFSLVPCPIPVEDKREIRSLRVSIEGLRGLIPPDGPAQQCHQTQKGFICELGLKTARERSSARTQGGESHPQLFLRSTFQAPSDHPDIRGLARSITLGAQSDREAVERIIRWMESNIRKAPVDVFTALDALKGREAECQGVTYLFTALARASGIPTRVVNGLVYSPDHLGFLYHTWAESLIGGRWVPVDPTFGQLPADPTHIVIIEGEDPSAVLPMVRVMGRLRIRLLDLIKNQSPPPP